METAQTGPARRANRAAVGMASLIAAALYALAYVRHPERPAGPGQGWWAWYDQERYLKAALAWASGSLDPAQHWYLPGYALLGAPFAPLTPANPFLLPNLACLLASLWLTAALAARLAPDWRFAPALGALAFLGASVLPPVALDTWVVPWTSTAAAPLALACLLAAAALLRRFDRPEARLAGPAFAVGLAGAAIGCIRPSDAAALLAAVGVVLAPAMLLARPGLRRAGGAVLGASAGVACGVALLLVPHLAVHGAALGEYAATSARTGFEPRLLPLRWVTVVLSPRPLFPDGQGLAEVFPWVVPGLAGLAACLATPPGRSGRAVHIAVAAAMAAQTVLLLAYRDLHPTGLWRFANHHYFKWLLPLLALYALLLGGLALRRRWAGLLAGAAALMLLLPWQARLSALRPAGQVEADGSLTLPPLPLGVHDVVLAAAAGSFGAIYHGGAVVDGRVRGAHELQVGARGFKVSDDFKAFPRPGGFMLAPLRPLGAGPVRFTPGLGVTLAADTSPLLGRQGISFGLPCWFGPGVPECRPMEPIPPAPLPADGILRFDGSEARYLAEGWSGAEPSGRWTEGPRASLRLPRPAGRMLITVRGYALVPAGAAPLQVRLLADGTPVGAWRVVTAEEQVLEAKLPAGTAGAVLLTLEMDAPRRPRDVIPGSTDGRSLGLHVRSVTVGALP